MITMFRQIGRVLAVALLVTGVGAFVASSTPAGRAAARDNAILDEPLKLIGAPPLHAKGITGRGVRIGVIDENFFAHQRMLGGALPASTVAKSFHPNGIDGETELIRGQMRGNGHGTAVAEVVHGVAPDAQLFLVNIDGTAENFDPVSFNAAVDYLISERVDIIVMSLGLHRAGPGDGSGPTNAAIDRATDAGILWVIVSGNEADSHWGGVWNDPDGNGVLNFAGDDEAITARFVPGIRATVTLRWEESWDGACSDFQIALYSVVGNGLEAVSRQRQDCSPGSHPYDTITFRPQSRTPHYVEVTRLSGSGTPKLDLFIQASRGPVSFEYTDPARSLRVPGDNERALIVGAVDLRRPFAIQDFSSQGPTADGRIKLDIVAPDGLSTLTAFILETAILDPFHGTSAAAPVVAGAAALVKQLHPDWSGQQVKAALMAAAVDLGNPGRDTVFGAGRLDLRPFYPDAGIEP